MSFSDKTMSTHAGSQHRKARICVLQMLYQWEIGREDPAKVKASYWHEMRDLAPRTYATQLFDFAVADADEIDALITKYARKWKIDRMAAVDRNLLRMAIAEFRNSPDVPHPVVINEAIEIAKQFSSDDSHMFLNGVLDAISKELQGATNEASST